MRIESGYIFLKDLRFHAFHGVMPQERKVGGDFLVSLRMGYDISKAMRTDEVSDTLNYAEVYALVRKEMEQPSALLERVAGRIAEALFASDPKILSIDLWLTKVNPPMGADCQGAGVELHLINDKTKG
ncbi:MAG: dihydroneopterin aldolase [Prevotella sp.]|jgi:dihydroneopterin aldolase|uniref:dihydroneopterin aldolase n=1 Tax=Prevotella sp. tf2-5 TaxID=1761889 RepID=UPI0008E114F4|nr:dihydroneopterin aldolase [Prevotella sp. tf2-5]MBR2244830.1 dihydroneopterin aldolase [Prevotella sp.]MCR5712535.1 dihydroneopterin aldolase [Prevotella sp.]SFO79102.1 dihydroneopterin aldolase [Prevotella sp. tf2-5]